MVFWQLCMVLLQAMTWQVSYIMMLMIPIRRTRSVLLPVSMRLIGQLIIIALLSVPTVSLEMHMLIIQQNLVQIIIR